MGRTARLARSHGRPLTRAQRYARSPQLPAGAIAAYRVRLRRLGDEFAAKVRAALFHRLTDFAGRVSRADAADGSGGGSSALDGTSIANVYGRSAGIGEQVVRNSQAQFRRLGIDVEKEPSLDPLLKSWRQDTAARADKILEHERGTIKVLLDNSKNRTPEQLRDRINDRLVVTKSKLDSAAHDDILTLNGRINRERQTSAGIKKFTWTTAGDERVRDSHQAIDGQTYDWDDPPEVDGEESIPGEPPNCRCVPTPVVEEDEEPVPESGTWKVQAAGAAVGAGAGAEIDEFVAQHSEEPSGAPRGKSRFRKPAAGQRPESPVEQKRRERREERARRQKHAPVGPGSAEWPITFQSGYGPQSGYSDPDSPNFDPDRFESVSRQLLGQPLSDDAIGDLAGAGAIPGTRETFTTSGASVVEIVGAYNDNGAKSQIAQRISRGSDGQVVARQLYFALAPGLRGRGIAASVLRGTIERAAKIGVKRLEVNATGAERYVFARMGFALDGTGDAMASLLDGFKRWLISHEIAAADATLAAQTARTVHDIAATSIAGRHVGKEFLTSYGDAIPMTLELDHRNPGYQRALSYVRHS